MNDIQADVVTGVNVATDFSGYDALVLNRAMAGEIQKVIENARKAGLKIIYDCDDALDLVPGHNLAKKAVEPHIESYKFLLKEADLITTTTDILKGHFRSFTKKRIEVIPNCVDSKEWFEETNFNSDKIRIGFMGSNTHIKDINIALRALCEIQKSVKIKLYLFGFSTTHQTANSWINASGGNRRTDFHEHLVEFKRLWTEISNTSETFWVQGVSISEFLDKAKRLKLDIGLCPLEDDDFNSKKSCIKFYEYATINTCTIASAVAPYLGEVNFVKKNITGDWVEGISMLLEKDFREKILSEQRQWVLENRDIKTWTKIREDIYKDICKDI